MKDDRQLEREVGEKISWALGNHVETINVKVNEGRALLTGNINSLPRKTTAGFAAMQIQGITSLSNELEVIIPEVLRRQDEDIEKSIRNAIKFNSSKDYKNIRARVKNSFVTLEGSVDREYQRARVRDLAEHVAGVKGLINLIKVVTTFATTADINNAENVTRSAPGITTITHEPVIDESKLVA